jgi:putative transposase
MPAPRQIIPGVRYLLTRRCALRKFRLRPSAETNNVFRYCLAFAANRTGVLIHAICVMSNHIHLVVTDVDGRLPEFTRELHRLTAKVMNALQGEDENLWNTKPCHALRLGDDGDVIEWMAYVATNPVSSGLVSSPAKWPGLLRAATSSSIQERAQRPRRYFSERGVCPPSLELLIAPPSGIAEFEGRLTAAIEAKIQAAHQSLRRKRCLFLGRKKVLKASFAEKPSSREPTGQLVPQVGAKDPSLRSTLLAARRFFLASYREALEKWRAGVRVVCFPHGTWWLRVFHGVPTAPPIG